MSDQVHVNEHLVAYFSLSLTALAQIKDVFILFFTKAISLLHKRDDSFNPEYADANFLLICRQPLPLISFDVDFPVGQSSRRLT